MKEIYVFGHRKPDTDSVTSAIALANLKNSMGIKAKPMILGPINKETEFVLNYFNVKVPELLEDVKLQIKDLKYYKDCFIEETASIKKTYDYMFDKNITGVPIVDKNKKFKGLLTSKMIGNELIKGDFTKIETSYQNIIDILEGEEVLKFDDEIIGTILAASFRSTTILNTVEFKPDTIMIVGDRHSIIEAAINSKIKLLVIVGNLEIKEEHLNKALENKVNIIKTHYDTFHTAKLIGLSNYCRNILSNTRNISINENDYYDDFKDMCLKLGYNNYPVISSGKKCLGLVRITDIKDMNKKQVILVDHNEANQSVEGLEEAEILEIIDHHKISTLSTKMPINFRNMTVGSTNTIIYSMYIENNIVIPSDIAGLMLSGILSDTLKFTSPTTTEYDKYVAKRLATMSLINIDEYASKMFKAGTNLEGKTFNEIIEEDMKIFDIGSKKVAISQIITLDSEDILEKKQDYINKINEIKENRYFDLLIMCVTDIIKDGSYIFYNESSSDIVKEALNLDNVEQGYFFHKCLSRKKQLVPLVMEVMK